MRKILPTILFATIVSSILGAILFNGINNASAASSITLNVSPTITLDVTPSNAGSTSTTDTTNIAIKTDNATGYTLSIAAGTNAISNGNNTVPNANNTNVSLINTDPNCTTTAICTIASIAANTTFADVSSFNTNTWGYMLSKYNTSTTNWDNLYNYYQVAPTTTASDIDTTSAPNADTFNNYNLSIATKVDDTMTPGTYENTFIIAAITNPLVYNVTYTNASGISASNMPTNISGGMTAAGEGSFIIPSTTPTRMGYTFNKWCTVSPTTTNGVDACTGGDEYASSATYNLTGTTSPQSVTLYSMWSPISYVQTTQIRYENADGTWGSYSTAETKSVNYDSTYSWSTSQLSNFDSTTYQAASVAQYTVTGAKTNQVSIYRKKFTCYIQYRFQNADGSYGGYTAGTNSSLRYGQTCSWSRNSDATYKAASYSTTISSNVSQSVNVDRNTFTCTKRYRLQNADGTYPSSYTSGGSESIRYGATCSYSQSASYYTTKSTSTTITAAATLSLDLPRTTYALTVNRNTTYISSVSGAGTYRWGQSVSIGATASTGSAFNGWSVSSGSSGTFANAANASTTYTMPKGASTIYANGKCATVTNISGTMQTFNPASTYCNGSKGTLTDNRDNQQYTVAKINGQWWMTRNLAIGCAGSGTTYSASRKTVSLTSSNTNLSTTWSTSSAATFNASNSSPTSGYTTAGMQCHATYGGFYNYKAATAGTISGASNTTAASSDICPKGWRLPTSSEISGITGSVSAFSPVYSGYYNSGELNRATLDGYWWTSTANGATNRYRLFYDTGSLGVDNINRCYGYSVRCVH